MKRVTLGVLTLLVLALSLSPVYGEKADKPAAEAVKKTKLMAPYHKLNLTAEQSEKIAAIQAEIRAQIKLLEQQEKERVLAVLDDAQKAELAKQEAAKKEKQSQYAQERRAKMEAAEKAKPKKQEK